MERHVLDASALLIYFGFDPRQAASTVDNLLTSAFEGKSKLLMCGINWGEIFYTVWARRGQAKAEDVLRHVNVNNLPIKVVDPDREIIKRAASLKATLGLGYADSFAAALAQASNATLVAADHDFDKIDKLIQVAQLL